MKSRVVNKTERRGGLAAESAELKRKKSKGGKAKAKQEPKPEAEAKADAKLGVRGPAAGSLGIIMGHSVGSVIKRLGKEGLGTHQVEAVLESMGLRVKRETVAWNVSAGKVGRGAVADLTAEQVGELKAIAAKAEKSEKQHEPAKAAV